METCQFLHNVETGDFHRLLNFVTVIKLGLIRAGHITRMVDV